MGFDRRVVVALAVLALIIAPAAVLRAVCAGHSCDEPEKRSAGIPFCSLPEAQRVAIVAGFREGRSPDILTVADDRSDEHVPLIFSGTGVRSGVPVRVGVTLDAVAPTLAEIIGLERPHPDVRSGRAIPEVSTDEVPRLVLLVVVKGLGAKGFESDRWTHSRRIAEAGTTTDADIGSQPNDPASVLTTIGTGGLPFQHGITGALVRDDAGRLVRAWGAASPVSVIATLADDMDELQDQEPLIGLLAHSASDRGLIGGNWYLDNDRDIVRVERRAARTVAIARHILKAGFGRDATTDLLALTFSGPPRVVDHAVARITKMAESASEGRSVLALTGTGPVPGDNGNAVEEIERTIAGRTRFIEGAVPGGFFVDQDALTRTGKTEDAVIDAVKSTGSFTDAFAAITVSFARYC